MCPFFVSTTNASGLSSPPPPSPWPLLKWACLAAPESKTGRISFVPRGVPKPEPGHQETPSLCKARIPGPTGLKSAGRKFSCPINFETKIINKTAHWVSHWTTWDNVMKGMGHRAGGAHARRYTNSAEGPGPNGPAERHPRPMGGLTVWAVGWNSESRGVPSRMVYCVGRGLPRSPIDFGGQGRRYPGFSG